MAINIFQIALHNTSGLPRDDSVNSLYYEINAPETHEGAADDIAAAYQAHANQLNAAFFGMTIKAFNPGPGAAKFIKKYPLSAAGGLAPTEVALCLSYRSNDDGPAGQRRGRIFLPFAPANAVRPAQGLLIDPLLSFGEKLANVGTLGNTTWRLWSRKTNTFHDIDEISVDNEWDTQRRRGMRATVRTKRTVQ